MEEVIPMVVDSPVKPQEGVDYFIDLGSAKALGKEAISTSDCFPILKSFSQRKVLRCLPLANVQQSLSSSETSEASANLRLEPNPVDGVVEKPFESNPSVVQ
jgi:hypothetical protein